MSVPPPPDLSEEDGRILLALARTALEAHFRDGARPGAGLAAARSSRATPVDRLAAVTGVFVSLHLDGALRGCVGALQGRSPLRESVGAVAVAAAIADPRFEALRKDDLERIALDVTVLGAAVAVAGPESIRIGRHGLMVSRGARRGLLLPQVAEERGWDAETFLAETCRKAGLEPSDWRSQETRVEAFEARVFREERRAGGPRREAS